MHQRQHLVSQPAAVGHYAPVMYFSAVPAGILAYHNTMISEQAARGPYSNVHFRNNLFLGGDPVPGTSFIDCLEAFEADPQTRAVCMLGEIGGTDEQMAAEYVRDRMSKPVVGFIAGQTAPPGRRMGHAGAIISGSEGTAAEKMKAFRDCGIAVAERLGEQVLDAWRGTPDWSAIVPNVARGFEVEDDILVRCVFAAAEETLRLLQVDLPPPEPAGVAGHHDSESFSRSFIKCKALNELNRRGF